MSTCASPPARSRRRSYLFLRIGQSQLYSAGMEPTNQELAQSFEEAATAAEKAANALEVAASSGRVFIGLDEPLEDVISSNREYARVMRLNAQGARELRD